MRHAPLCLHACLAVALSGGGVLAVQAQPAASVGASPDAQVERRIERIRIEDRGVTTEELRYGGETQSIQVTPRNLPAYEMQPIDGARSRQSTRDGLGQASGARVWNLVRF